MQSRLTGDYGQVDDLDEAVHVAPEPKEPGTDPLSFTLGGHQRFERPAIEAFADTFDRLGAGARPRALAHAAPSQQPSNVPKKR